MCDDDNKGCDKACCDPEMREGESWAIDEEGRRIPGTGMRLEKAERCPSEFVYIRQCIGAKGHSGSHWCYSETGMYEQWWDETSEPAPENVAASSTPDGNENYVRPSERHDETYMGKSKWHPIED